MKKQSIIIWIYAGVLLIGGLIGFIKAHSVISLIASAIFAALLFGCGYAIRKENRSAYLIAIGLTVCLLAFFAYRFFLSHQFMPAGLMTLLSAGMLGYLSSQWNTVKMERS